MTSSMARGAGRIALAAAAAAEVGWLVFLAWLAWRAAIATR